MIKEYKIIITGGGSGGHTMPAVAVIETLEEYFKKINKKYIILYIGSHNGIERNIAQKFNINYKSISTGKFRRYFSLKNIIDIFNVINGYFKSLRIIKKFCPDLLFSTGGFVSVPPVIAAKRLKIPVIIHEQTIDAGLANKIASKFADKVCITFHESKRYFPDNKTVITGIPLRKLIFNGSKERAYKRFGFDKKLPVVYFTGGGLGCHILNQIAINIIGELSKKCNIIYQTGRSENNNDYDEMINMFNLLNTKYKNRVKIFDFIHEELPDVFSITDLAVARSGAGTVNEFLALKIPAIFIPLAIATNDEQYKNAEIIQKLGGAVIIRENDLNEKLLLNTINEILFTKMINKMKINLKKAGFKNGSSNILDIIIKYLNIN